jgi:long-chain acyl-CoA synthetase
VAQITKEQLDEAAEGQTVPMRFLRTVAAHPQQVALRAKAGDGWEEVTYQDYADRVAVVTAGLEALGVGPGDRVVLMMRNIIDFHIIDLALLFRGATPISIYNSSAPEQIAYLAGHCEASMAIVEDIGFLERVLKVREELPALRSIVVLSDPDGLAGDDVVARSALFDGHAPADLQAATALCTPESLVTVIYTSGTTGPPKGVMLTHRNIVWTAEGYLRLLDVEPVGFRAVSYLPMAHIAERMSTHYLAAIGAYEVSTCPDPGQVAAYARDVRPQIMFGVPRVWEKLHAGVQAALGADPEKKASSTVPSRWPARSSSARRGAPPATRTWPPGPPSTRPPSPGSAPCWGSTRWSSPSPARRPSPPSSSAGTGPSACRCRRSTGCPRTAGR